jgi:hypothetical protein
LHRLPDIEIAVATLDVNVVTEAAQFVVDRFELRRIVIPRAYINAVSRK